jgi:hypothetical protein
MLIHLIIEIKQKLGEGLQVKNSDTGNQVIWKHIHTLHSN